MTVSTILGEKGREVVTIEPGASLAAVAKLLAEKRIGTVLILGADRHLIGIISERDIVQALAARGAAALDEPVSQTMTRRVETCNESETIGSIMERMTKGKFRHVPVVEQGRLVGIISIGDVVKHRLQEMEREIRGHARLHPHRIAQKPRRARRLIQGRARPHLKPTAVQCARFGAFRRRGECVMLPRAPATVEINVRGFLILLTALTIAASAASPLAAAGEKSMRLAQSSTTTGCMMACNSQAATCQSSCVAPSSSSSTSGGNTTASGSCLSNCSSQQLACQTTCARISPSQ